MATLGGHGLGGKIALAAACYNFDRVTGYFGIDTTPTNQFYFEPYQELRGYVSALNNVALNRPFAAISHELRNIIQCPKWRSIFESNLLKQDHGYTWKFNLEAIHRNIRLENPSSLLGWNTTIGLYTGRVNFTFPDNSRYVYLNTNTMPMLNVCPKARGFNEDIFSIQGDEGVQNHWVYERDEEVNAFGSRIAHFLKHYDGVHTLLQSRDEVGRTYIPDLHRGRDPQPDYADDVRPAHYYHNWRFNNVYNKDKTA